MELQMSWLPGNMADHRCGLRAGTFIVTGVGISLQSGRVNAGDNLVPLLYILEFGLSTAYFDRLRFLRF